MDKKIINDVPDWVTKYNDANYQSGAGKALRIVMNKLEDKEEEFQALIELAKIVANDRSYGDHLLSMLSDKQKYTILKLISNG